MKRQSRQNPARTDRANAPKQTRISHAIDGRRTKEITEPAVNVRANVEFLAGGGEMGERIRAFDWGKTPLGSPETWPAELAGVFRSVLENSRDVIYRFNIQVNRFEYVSPSATEVIGFSPEELMSQDSQILFDMICPEDRAKFSSALTELERTGTAEAEYRQMSKAGRYRWLSNRMSLSRDQNGVPLYRHGNIRDITDRKQAEEALRESEERFRTVVENSRDGINLLDLKTGRYIFMSPAQVKLTGFSAEEMNNFTAEEAYQRVHPDDRELSIKQQSQVAAGQDPGNPIQYRWKVKSGEYRWFSDSRSLIRDAKGQPVALVGISRDITDSKQAEEAVAAAHRQAQSIIDNTTAIIYAFDLEERFLIANTAIAELLNSTPAQMIGKRRHEFMPKEDADWHEANDRQVMEAGRPLDFEEHSELKGRSITWLTTKFPLRDAQGMIYAVAGISTDVSGRKKAEEDLKRAKEELETRVAERTQELFDKANQLRALAGELTLAEQRERRRLAKVLHDHLQQILVGGKFRLSVLGIGADEILKQGLKEIEELIDESIRVSRSLTAELSPPILHEAGLKPGLEWLAKRMAETQALFVDLNLDQVANLPEPVTILLFECARELLFNAVKHAKVKSACLSLRQIDHALQLSVSDEGIGFDPELLPQAVESGSGYGLFGIRERLHLLGGKLEIKSALGQGSQFIVTMPTDGVPAKQSDPMPTLSPIHVERMVPAPGRKMRLILADDHAVVRQGIANVLGEEGDIEVIGAAANGREAVDLAARLLPDVILMDISMPVLNGVEATRIIRNELPDICIIGLSMFEEDERAQAIRDAGAYAYLTKSGPIEELVQAIRAGFENLQKKRSAATH